MRKLFITSIMLMITLGVYAQGTSINTTGAPSDPSAILDVSSTTQGTLITRMTTAQRDAISNPAEGLMIFNLDDGCLEFYYNSAWVNLCAQINNLVCGAMIATITNSSNVTCAGGSDGDATVVASGGAAPYTYAWSNGAGNTTNPTGLVAGTYAVTATDNNNCTATTTITILDGTQNIPATPGAIFGDANPCPNSSGNVYSIGTVANAASYNWSVPAGATITNGAGTNSITVTYGTSSGDVTVTADNVCGSSAASTLTVTLAPGGAGGTQNFSSGTTHTFTVPACVTSITIDAYGAQGGTLPPNCSGKVGGLGAYVYGTFSVTPGDVLKIMVGSIGASSYGGSGGGGGTFVWNETNSNTLMIAAAAGGGAGCGGNGAPGSHTQATVAATRTAAGGTNGAGGSGGSSQTCPGAGGGTGWYGNGQAGSNAGGCGGNPGQGGSTPLTGGAGGSGSFSGSGGFGGGGGGNNGAGGGGGGYNGGGGSNNPDFPGGAGGGGGGSYNAGTNTGGSTGVRSGSGTATITW